MGYAIRTDLSNLCKALASEYGVAVRRRRGMVSSIVLLFLFS